MYEKNPSVGGTWFENRYPGRACDVPSHNYVYSFEPNADFSSVYAVSEEILGYFENFVEKHGLGKYFKFSHTVEKTTWEENKGHWTVEIKHNINDKRLQDCCHILIHACGFLNKASWPQLPGLGNSEGVKVHSAQYDPSLSLKDKNVLLVGAGSSSAQILPAIQPIAKSLTISIRSPTWLLPDIATEGGKFKPEDIESFKQRPETLLELRQINERTMNSIFSKPFRTSGALMVEVLIQDKALYLKGIMLQEQCKSLLESEMKKILGGDQEHDKLIPKFAVGCKRVVPSGFRYLSVSHNCLSGFLN